MPLKPYSGMTFPRTQLRQRCTGLAAHHVQVKTCVIASSYKRAAELLHLSRVSPNITVSQMRGWWSVSGNDVQVALIAHGEGVYLVNTEFYAKASDYIRVWPET